MMTLLKTALVTTAMVLAVIYIANKISFTRGLIQAAFS